MLSGFSKVAVIWGSDDLGFRSGTLMSPDFLRAKILPWHKRCAEVARRSKPSLLHGGGYCLRTGNTAANYVPLENFLSMIDEGRRYRP